jgi:hypothetical protein
MNHNALPRARHRQSVDELKLTEEYRGNLLTEPALKSTRFAHCGSFLPLYNSNRLGGSSFATGTAAAHPIPQRAQ